jgi:death-on-curing protein
MAAAYLFHLCRNHAFFDGNKRTALASASVFLLANGSRLAASQAQKLALVMSVAAGEVGKADVLKFFRRHVRPRRRNPGRRAGMPGHGS